MRHDALKLAFGFSFADLYDREGLVRLDRVFMDRLQASDAALANRLLAARANPDGVATKDENNQQKKQKPQENTNNGELFGVEAELQKLAAQTTTLEPLYSCKRLFV